MAHAGLEHGVSQLRYRNVRPDEAELRKAIRGIAQERPSSVIAALVLC